ncbi:hypothetical protein [Corynebacterium striatum]|uniref:hypothetical protein n=1 Tax=Corynebacterium striatum TaxID=43770 RepID=UPI003B5C947F
MTKFGQFITTFLIGLFIIALGAMIALSNMREQPPVERTLESAVSSLDKTNLSVSAVVPSEVLGHKWQGMTTICADTKKSEIKEIYGINAEDLGITEDVDKNTNYFVAIGGPNKFYAEKLNREKINLCPTGQPLQPASTQSILPFVKEGETWKLAA